MGTEIERTFLVHDNKLPTLPPPICIEQAYLGENPCVRVRTMTREGVSVAFLTIKGLGLFERPEFEWEIPIKDAQEILGDGLWLHALSKNRYQIGPWEVDEFTSVELEGLWLAEIELSDINEPFERPPWLGQEVSKNPAYTNMALARDGLPHGT